MFLKLDFLNPFFFGRGGRLGQLFQTGLETGVLPDQAKKFVAFAEQDSSDFGVSQLHM